MAYQNINQYNFRRWGLLPVNEITDICLASDEKDYDQEVIFSPFLIGEDDGNRKAVLALAAQNRTIIKPNNRPSIDPTDENNC